MLYCHKRTCSILVLDLVQVCVNRGLIRYDRYDTVPILVNIH